jgi:hypothetical protein
MLHVQPISTLLGPQIPQLNVFYLIMVKEVLHEFSGHVNVPTAKLVRVAEKTS